MADGAVKFITDSIDTNNTGLISVSSFIGAPNYRPAGSSSPYGLWGALGTRGAKETLALD